MTSAPLVLSNLITSGIEKMQIISTQTIDPKSFPTTSNIDEKSMPHFFPACHCDDCFLEDDTTTSVPSKTSESWKKIRYALIWSPFLQQYKRHKYPWLQLAGHQGVFCAGEEGTILKKHCATEATCLLELKDDLLRAYVPHYFGIVEKGSEKFLKMQDLLSEFKNPSIMDCKLGIRSFTEDELTKACEALVPRKDMYLKMIQVDPNEPTLEERQEQAVTKPRYMKWRDFMSSTATLGFRIEGLKKNIGEVDHNFKKTKDVNDLTKYFRDFTNGNLVIIKRYTQRLRAILATVEVSKFAQTHELIGTSLFFAHDNSLQVSVWMIDFGKSAPLPTNKQVTHHDFWHQGSYEDGYCIGLESLINILQNLMRECIQIDDQHDVEHAICL